MATNRSNEDSDIQTSAEKTAQATNVVKAQKPITPIRQRLMVTWVVWLVFRLLGLPILISIFNPSNPDIIGGIAWQALWLVPAFV